jgi:CDGSH-type Zn-finger protein
MLLMLLQEKLNIFVSAVKLVHHLIVMGRHQGGDNEPLEYTASGDEQLYICGCGKTSGKPFCDGSHNN